MPNAIGMPIWYELMTPDVAGAEAFYAAVVGWSAMPFPMPEGGGAYTILQMQGAGVAGLLQRTADAPMAPGWYAYFHVADVDAKAAEVIAASGSVHMPPTDLPNVGRIAMVEDPQGVFFYLMKPAPPPEMEGVENTSFSATLPGRCSWNELVTPDHQAALAFYGDLLGWTKAGAMPMPEMGDYTFFAAGDLTLGAMMDQPKDGPPKRWGFYFAIPDVDAAVDIVTANGGTVTMGPHEVPGGQRILIATDPQGIPVGFVSGERQ